MQITQQKDVTAKIGESKLRSNVDWQGGVNPYPANVENMVSS